MLGVDMKKLIAIWTRHSLKITITLVLILVSLGVVLGTRNQSRQSQPQNPVWRGPANVENNEKDRRPLKEKAKEAGRYRAIQPAPDLHEFNTLADLSKKADLIVIATALHNSSLVSPDGNTINLEYSMQVEHVYKGTVDKSRSLLVSLPGGIANFPDGTSAEIGAPWFKKMMNASTYLLFLNSQNDRPWITTGGPRGVFEIPTTSTNRNVTSHSLLEGDPMRVFNDMDVIEFLRAVRQSLNPSA